MKAVIITGKRIDRESPRLRYPHAELWGIGHANAKHWDNNLRDWTRWFDVHQSEPCAFYIGYKRARPHVYLWYQQQDGTRPIYLIEADPTIPGSVAFPRKALEAEFGTRFTCSVDWIMAFAIQEGFDQIILNGIGVNTQDAFQFMHKGILYWIGYAEGRGIEVIIDEPSVYTQPALVYGYEMGPPPSRLYGRPSYRTTAERPRAAQMRKRLELRAAQR